jgi:hypothetical protein
MIAGIMFRIMGNQYSEHDARLVFLFTVFLHLLATKAGAQRRSLCAAFFEAQTWDSMILPFMT